MSQYSRLPITLYAASEWPLLIGCQWVRQVLLGCLVAGAIGGPAVVQAQPNGPVEPAGLGDPAGPEEDPGPGPAGGSDPLAERSAQILVRYCGNCHATGKVQVDILNVDDPNSVAGYITPGEPDASQLLSEITSGSMPPDNNDRPGAEDIQVLTDWIRGGSQAPAAVRASPVEGGPGPGPQGVSPTGPVGPAIRQPIDLVQVLGIIHQDLMRTRASDRIFRRYFTLNHLYNNPKINLRQLRLYRAALSKVLNSISYEAEIVVPQPIDELEIVYVIDLREFGLHQRGLWDRILRCYPYGLRFDRVRDPNTRELARQVELLTGTSLSYLRGDWFAYATAQPPLYNEILDIPETALELERRLNVDVIGDFLNNRLHRAGFAISNVSAQNRLVDRHPALYGSYWKSYDFAPFGEFNELHRYPLGPIFKQNPFPDQAFLQAGGEIIFTLPNGLQAYMLVENKNGVDERIDKGPPNVVADKDRTTGTTEVVNGISCMSCHKHGMINFSDDILLSLNEGAVFGGPAEKVQELYPEPDEMKKVVGRDRKRFMASLEEAVGPFLQVHEDAERKLESFDEPVSTMAKYYYREVTLDEAAYELGLPDPQLLAQAIRFNPNLQKLGLGPLNNDRPIKRENWESDKKDVVTVFQAVAREFDIGTPLVYPRQPNEKCLANE